MIQMKKKNKKEIIEKVKKIEISNSYRKKRMQNKSFLELKKQQPQLSIKHKKYARKLSKLIDSNVISKSEFQNKMSFLFSMYEKNEEVKTEVKQRRKTIKLLKKGRRSKHRLSPLYSIEFVDEDKNTNPLDINIELPLNSFDESIKLAKFSQLQDGIDSEDDGNVTTSDSEDVTTSDSESEKEEEEESNEEDEESGEESEEHDDWITPDNIKEKKLRNKKNTVEWNTVKSKEVGCVTFDFAMQNVCLTMGLNVVSIEGYKIKYLKKWIKRCYGCYTIETDMRRKFCSNCGNNTLLRVSCDTNENGDLVYYINAQKKLNLRGTKYQLKRRKGGKQSVNNHILREDMLKNFKGGKPKKYSTMLKYGNRSTSILNSDSGISSTFRNTKQRRKTGMSNTKSKYSFNNGYNRKNPNVVVKKRRKKH